ncbi:MAG TPA: hypothetical protein VK866_18200 [Acidimicrobiales bacterium]|nr:hypothetical protein [Acidimicrobiales bacterium]
MSDSTTNDQLSITIQMGDDYQPTPEVAAAISNLMAALGAPDDAEVAGFASLSQLDTWRGTTSFITKGPTHGRWTIEEGTKFAPQPRGTSYTEIEWT